MFYALAKALIVGPVVRLRYRPWITGLEHVPYRGAAILASNHLSASDTVLLPVMVPREISFLAKSEFFIGTGFRGALVRRFFLLARQLPMDRAGGRGASASLEAGQVALREGRLLGIYPEGTRSPDGRLYRGRVGVARLALQTGLPVIPVAMIPADADHPRRAGRRGVGIVIGEPLRVSRDAGAGGQASLRALTNQVMERIRELSGQEYVDAYSPPRGA